ncbi:hypothetical protein [Foetidibacter luteolus]|uniref:hypothetical protein n=1 Tax=Foetidibacter luteolus TaxID=2608880 RepID=UPI001A99A2AA|nr:hypothetical protein [Foetidibacter luteolus]
MSILTRKKFIRLFAFGSGVMVTAQPAAFAQSAQQKPPALPPELVKEFVIAGHGNLEKVKQMLDKEPGLLNACWDWGGGDFETAIEGAGHIGSRDCANYLLQQGARMNIFCAAMLGQLEVVKALLTAYPQLKTSRGPHGLQLLHHAAKGGDDARETLAYLQSLGAS